MSVKKQFLGKIGYCNNKYLGLVDKNGNIINGGHYVYIRELNNNTCNVNIITSLEDKNNHFDNSKIIKIKRGYLYPIPKDDSNFSRWSAINLDGNIRNIPTSFIVDVGKKKIKHRHKWFVGKFTKKINRKK